MSVKGKYLRDENNEIFSPISAAKSIIINECSLYDYIKNKEEIPVCTKTIYTSQSGLTFGHNNWVDLCNAFYGGYTIPKSLPILPGFKRYVRMKVTYTDNVNGSLYSIGPVIGSFNSSDGSYQSIDWPLGPVWGGLADRTTSYSKNEREYDSLPKSHTNFKIIIHGNAPIDAQGKVYEIVMEYIDRLVE